MYRSLFKWQCSCGAAGRWADDRKAVEFRAHKHLRDQGCEQVLVYDSQRSHTPSILRVDSKHP